MEDSTPNTTVGTSPEVPVTNNDEGTVTNNADTIQTPPEGQSLPSDVQPEAPVEEIHSDVQPEAPVKIFNGQVVISETPHENEGHHFISVRIADGSSYSLTQEEYDDQVK